MNLRSIIAGIIGLCLGVGALADGLADGRRVVVGTRVLQTEVAGNQIDMRVFYPTPPQTPAATAQRFGPWVLPLVKNARIAAGRYPLVLISHGLGGNYWNHHLLAQQLVQAGFIVAAVQHPHDLLRVGTPQFMRLRPLELGATLAFVLAERRIGPHIDPHRIGAFGFSLGGYTVLAAAGGQLEVARVAQHCAQPNNDPEFCRGEPGGAPLPLWLRVRRVFNPLAAVELAPPVLVPRLNAIALAAPVGVPFADLSRVTIPTLLIRAGADRVLRYPYHAESIHKRLPSPHEYRVIDGLHHYAFLSPFPARIARAVGAPAQDPDGFDRHAFLRVENRKIVAFFQTKLPTQANQSQANQSQANEP